MSNLIGRNAAGSGVAVGILQQAPTNAAAQSPLPKLGFTGYAFTPSAGTVRASGGTRPSPQMSFQFQDFTGQTYTDPVLSIGYNNAASSASSDNLADHGLALKFELDYWAAGEGNSKQLSEAYFSYRKANSSIEHRPLMWQFDNTTGSAGAGTISSTSGNTAVTGAGTNFTAADIGKTLWTSAGVSVGTIVDVTSTTAITLLTGASVTLSGSGYILDSRGDASTCKLTFEGDFKDVTGTVTHASFQRKSLALYEHPNSAAANSAFTIGQPHPSYLSRGSTGAGIELYCQQNSSTAGRFTISTVAGANIGANNVLARLRANNNQIFTEYRYGLGGDPAGTPCLQFGNMLSSTLYGAFGADRPSFFFSGAGSAAGNYVIYAAPEVNKTVNPYRFITQTANGTGEIAIDKDGAIIIQRPAAAVVPATPAANQIVLWWDEAAGALKFKNSAGTTKTITAA